MLGVWKIVSEAQKNKKTKTLIFINFGHLNLISNFKVIRKLQG